MKLDQHFNDMTELMAVKPHEVNVRQWGDNSFFGTKDNPRDGTVKTARGRMEWWGASSLKKVIAMKDEGWPEGLARIERMLDRMEMPQLASIRRKRIRSDFGDHLDMQAVYNGQLDRAWEATTRAMHFNVGVTTTTVFVDLCASYGCEASEMFWRGAAAVMLADAFEKSGRSVRIIAFDTCNSQYKGYSAQSTTSLLVKDHGEILNLEKVAMITALAGFWRYWFWRAWASVPRVMTSGFGYVQSYRNGPITNLNSLPKHLRELASDEANVMISDVWSQREADRLLKAMQGEVDYERQVI